MKDIVILNHDPLISRIEESFCIPNLITKGVKITYLDLSNFYIPKFEAPYQLERNYVVKLNSEPEILEYLNNVDIANTIFISEAAPIWISRHIYKFFTDNNAYLIRIQIYPHLSTKKNLIKNILSIPFKDLIKTILFKSYVRFHRIKLWDKVLSSTCINEDERINHPDYEEYIKSKCKVDINNKHIVFLDECFPTHPEIKYWQGKNFSDLIIPYQQSLKQLFDQIESVFKKDVIICAHPKSQYQGNEFGNRKIIKGETASLVREAAFVLMHCSMSSVFAILNDKPIVILSSDEYKNNHKDILQGQKEFAKYFDLPIFDIKKWNPCEEDIKPLNHNIRKKYIYSYLTSTKNQEKKNSEIIYEYLCKL